MCTDNIEKSCQELFNTNISCWVWGNNKEQKMRTISFEINCLTKPNNSVLKQIIKRLLINNSSKVIVYANTRMKVDNFEIYSENKLDATGTKENKLYTIDDVKVYGPLTVQEKGYNLCTFMNKITSNYNPRILIATSGATNTGIDLDSIYGVYRLDMPSNRIDIVQERGCARRFKDATPRQRCYCINFLISSFEYKIIQINNKNDEILDKTYRDKIQRELLEMLKKC